MIKIKFRKKTALFLYLHSWHARGWCLPSAAMEGAEAAAALAPADAEPQQQEEQAPAQAEQEQAPAQEQAEVHPDAGFANGEQVTQAEQPAPTGHSAPPVGTGRGGAQ